MFNNISQTFLPSFTLKTPEWMTIEDSGYARDMEVAKDEIYWRPRSPSRSAHLLQFPSKNSAEAVRQYALSLDTTKKQTTFLVLYEKGKPRHEKTRCLLSDEILVELSPTIDSQVLAKILNTSVKKAAGGLNENFYVFTVSETGAALAVASYLRSLSNQVISAEPLLIRKKKKRALPNDPLISKQWHLKNTGQNKGKPGIDCHVTSLWGNPFGSAGSILGRGIRIGVIDDGLETTHSDLKENVDNKNDYDFVRNDANPNPYSDPDLFDYDAHGTSVAGLAAASANNHEGISGLAPKARLVGLKIMELNESVTDTGEAEALSWKNNLIAIKNNSWGPFEAFVGPGKQTASALKKGALEGRQGRGTIFVWAAGNNENSDEKTTDDSNYDGYANSIYTIAVGGVKASGKVALPNNSEPGANLVVCAPTFNITTTDLTGEFGWSSEDYTSDFGGTSAAAPMVSGVVALMLEKNPNLGWRDVQEILMQSARKISEKDKDWIVNAAGFHFNYKYGAGLVDAQKAVTLSEGWINLPKQTSLTVKHNQVENLPEDQKREINFEVNKNFRVEHVTLTTTLTEDILWDLSITLTSPSGTLSQLKHPNPNIYESGPHFKWTFMTTHNWGENSQGSWLVTFKDNVVNHKKGALKTAHLTVYGSPALP